MSYIPQNYAVATAPTLTTVQEHYAGIDEILGDVRREVRLTGGITNLTLANHSNALIILTAGVNQLTSSGSNTFPCTIWNRSGSDADILGVTLPPNEIGMTIIDGANNIAEVSQTFSGVTSVTASAPLASGGGTTPNISITTNAANGVPQLDALSRYPAFDGSQITNIAAAAMTGATGVAAGTAGSVPIPAAGDQAKVLLGNATWSDIPPFQDTSVVVQDSLDPTKQIMFEAGNITGGQTRIITMDDADVDLSLVKEVDREFTFNANAALTVADHRNALIICATAGITLTLPTVGNLYATGINTSGGNVTVGGTTVGSLQLFTIVTVGAVGVVKAST